MTKWNRWFHCTSGGCGKKEWCPRYLPGVYPSHFLHNAVQRLAELPIKHILTTDTVSFPVAKMKPLEGRITILSIAPLLGEVIRRAHQGRSVGEMFNE